MSSLSCTQYTHAQTSTRLTLSYRSCVGQGKDEQRLKGTCSGPSSCRKKAEASTVICRWISYHAGVTGSYSIRSVTLQPPFEIFADVVLLPLGIPVLKAVAQTVPFRQSPNSTSQSCGYCNKLSSSTVWWIRWPRVEPSSSVFTPYCCCISFLVVSKRRGCQGCLGFR